MAEISRIYKIFGCLIANGKMARAPHFGQRVLVESDSEAGSSVTNVQRYL